MKCMIEKFIKIVDLIKCVTENKFRKWRQNKSTSIPSLREEEDFLDHEHIGFTFSIKIWEFRR